MSSDGGDSENAGLRRTICLPETAILEAILAERGPFANDEEEAECKVSL